MSVDTIDLDTALRLLDLPRTVGTDPESGEPITAQNGRYGPYLKKGTDSRTLRFEQQLFDITSTQALAIYAQPKYGARRASSALKEFEADPVSGKPINARRPLRPVRHRRRDERDDPARSDASPRSPSSAPCR